MSINIKLHKNDLPDDLDLGNVIAVDGEFMGLNVRRDPLMFNTSFNRKF
jgi:ribonuclease D